MSGAIKRAAGPATGQATEMKGDAARSASNAALLLRKAQADIGKGDVQSAMACVQDLMQTHPEDPAVLACLGMCHNLQGDTEASVDPLLKAIRLDPNNGQALYFLADSLHDIGETEQATAYALRALKLMPQDLHLLLLAANLRSFVGAYAEAAQLIETALQYHPDSYWPLYSLELLGQQTLKRSELYDRNPRNAEARRRSINRMLAAQRKKKLDGDSLAALLSLLAGSPKHFLTAVDIARTSVDFEPMTVPLSMQMIIIFWTIGDRTLSLQFCERCYERNPQYPGYRESLSNAWLASGRDHWNSAWSILTKSQRETRPDQHPQTVPLWTGEKLGKTKLLVYQEQGMGDAILCFRFLPMLAARGIKFDLWVLPELADLAAQATGYEKLVRTTGRVDPAALGYGYAVSLFGLIPALYLGPDEVRLPPIVRPPPEQAKHLREQIAGLPGVRIGLVFGGNPDRRDDWLRSVPLDALAAVSRIPGISWVNLGIDDRPDRKRALEMFRMTDLMSEVKTFADTAAIVDELDAVIAIDGSVAHVAGNLGKPLWVLVPPSADWRWQMGEDSNPWWPTSRVLRSDAPGSWRVATSRLETELHAYMAEAKPSAVP